MKGMQKRWNFTKLIINMKWYCHFFMILKSYSKQSYTRPINLYKARVILRIYVNSKISQRKKEAWWVNYYHDLLCILIYLFLNNKLSHSIKEKYSAYLNWHKSENTILYFHTELVFSRWSTTPQKLIRPSSPLICLYIVTVIVICKYVVWLRNKI